AERFWNPGLRCCATRLNSAPESGSSGQIAAVASIPLSDRKTSFWRVSCMPKFPWGYPNPGGGMDDRTGAISLQARAGRRAPAAALGHFLQDCVAEHRSNFSGAAADYIPELSKANPAHFGVAIATLDGHVYAAGDCDVEFTIQSISKAFVFALALEL